jgi:hypothetical protein
LPCGMRQCRTDDSVSIRQMHPRNLPFCFSFRHDSSSLLEKWPGHPQDGNGDLR